MLPATPAKLNEAPKLGGGELKNFKVREHLEDVLRWEHNTETDLKEVEAGSSALGFHYRQEVM
jgi:hypothetical protein